MILSCPAVLPGIKFWYDRVLRPDDLERPHGGDRQREPDRGRPQVGRDATPL